MLDIRVIRQNIDAVLERMALRGQDIDFAELFAADDKRKEILLSLEALRKERNTVSKEVGERKKNKQSADDIIGKMGFVGEEIRRYEEDLRLAEEQISSFMLSIPNIPHSSVVKGTSAEENPVVKSWGEKPLLNFAPKPHWEIGESLNILDFARGAKIAGARFTLYRGAGALLERALINFMLDLHTKEHGYTEILPPFMANSDSLRGTGQLPKFAEDLFKVEKTDYYLIPTAEVPVTNMHREEILAEKDLPLCYVAYSPCFRAEAGSYGKDTRGLIRQHQFNKVELVKFAKPETSYDELEKLTLNAESVLQRLGIHYRVVSLCGGDLGFSSAKTYDIEVWLPGQNLYREISSCSNFDDFQARRASIRYKRDDNQKVEFVHTLNGSGLAIGRTVVAVLENYQQADGTVVIPEALVPYVGGLKKIG
ncbi:MAG: serine--tRNA ligase [Deltaproteobacteria bacterium]|nr:serine--tRNA ligase [Deltaproteobacteria bacterium]